mgnify:CR=1 FL=1
MDPATASATELCAALAAGEVSSRELLEAMLARIDEVNPALNAVVALDVDRARAAAIAADESRAAGTVTGPLHAGADIVTLHFQPPPQPAMNIATMPGCIDSSSVCANPA